MSKQRTVICFPLFTVGALPASISPPSASSPNEAVEAWIRKKYEKRSYCVDVVPSQSAVMSVENKQVQAVGLNHSEVFFNAARQDHVRHAEVHPSTTARSLVSGMVPEVSAVGATSDQTSNTISAPDLIDFSSWD